MRIARFVLAALLAAALPIASVADVAPGQIDRLRLEREVSRGLTIPHFREVTVRRERGVIAGHKDVNAGILTRVL